MPSLSQLEYIVAVDKYRHFGRAAESCHISQPSLSMLILKAEEELGVTLFDRNKKPILPTQKGLEFIEQAKVILREVEKLKYLSYEPNGPLKGEFRMAVIPTLSPYLIPLFVSSFVEKHPKVKLHIDELKTSEIIRGLEREELDAGLLITPLNEKKIIEVPLFHEPLYLYVSPEHPLFNKKNISVSDLNGDDLWLLSEGHCFRDQMISICSRESDRRVYKNLNFESGSLETLMRLVEHSKGYTILPHLALSSLESVEKKKMLKTFAKPIPTREVSLVYNRQTLKENFIKALKEEILKQTIHSKGIL